MNLYRLAVAGGFFVSARANHYQKDFLENIGGGFLPDVFPVFSAVLGEPAIFDTAAAVRISPGVDAGRWGF